MLTLDQHFASGYLPALIGAYFNLAQLLSQNASSSVPEMPQAVLAEVPRPPQTGKITKGQGVINAYRQQRPLSEVEIAALPVLMRGSALRFLLTRTYDWLNPDPNALVRPKDPREYSKKLRFHNKVKHAREYGL